MKIGKVGAQNIEISFWKVLKLYIGMQLVWTTVVIVGYGLFLLWISI